MTGILWLPYSTQSGSVAGESASEIFHNTAQALAVSGLIIVAPPLHSRQLHVILRPLQRLQVQHVPGSRPVLVVSWLGA